MTRLLNSDVTKLGAYFVSCFLMAALITPWIYNAGLFLSDVTAAGTENSFLDWLGEKARGADFPTFFKRALLLSALVLLVPLLLSLRLNRQAPSLRDSPWSLYLPPHTVAGAQGQPLRNPRLGWLQLLTGFLLAAGIFFGMGLLLISMGWFQLEGSIDWAKNIKESIPAAISASLVEEVVFRGALLGIFLRTFRPFPAIVLLSLLFAALHFLQPPDDIAVFDRSVPLAEGMVFINPESSAAGLELLKLIGLRFLDPLSFVHEFVTLAVIGLILGQARYATASLWLPIGLHAGWVFSFKLFNKVTDRVDLDPRFSMYLGKDLKEGLIPLGALAITALLVYVYTRTLRPPPRHDRPAPVPGGEPAP